MSDLWWPSLLRSAHYCHVSHRPALWQQYYVKCDADREINTAFENQRTFLENPPFISLSCSFYQNFLSVLRFLIESFVLLSENWFGIVQVHWLNDCPDLVSAQDITHFQQKYKFQREQISLLDPDCLFVWFQIVVLCLI